MLNRLTVSTLLKAVISSTALIVIIGFSLNAWSSWIRLQQADRMVAIAAASADLFKTMANIRADRSTTNRQLTSDIQVFVDEFVTKMAEFYSADRPDPIERRIAAE